MIQQKLSPKEQVLAHHRASETNKPMFAAELIGRSSIHSFDHLLDIYHELANSNEMEAAATAETRDPKTNEITGYVMLYRLVET